MQYGERRTDRTCEPEVAAGQAAGPDTTLAGASIKSSAVDEWRSGLRNLTDNILRALSAADRNMRAAERFRALARPYVHEPRTQEIPQALFVSGLGRTTFPWRETADALHGRFGCGAQVHCLKGHEELTAGLRAVTYRDWVADVRAKILESRSSGLPPVIFAISTGALAAVQAIHELKAEGLNDPVLGLAIVAAPFELSRQWDKVRIAIAEAVVKRVPMVGEMVTAGISVKSGPAGGLVEGNEGTPDHPRIDVPVKTFLDLEYLRREVRGAFDSVTYPLLMMHGGLDKYTSMRDARHSFAELGRNSSVKRFVEFPRSPHHIMLGEERPVFMEAVSSWFAGFLSEQQRTDYWQAQALAAELNRPNPELTEGAPAEAERVDGV